MGIFDKLKKSIFQEEEKETKDQTSDKKSDVKADAKGKKASKKTSETSDKKEDAQDGDIVLAEMPGNKDGKYQRAHHILRSARVSEKTAQLASQHKYVFNVHPDANKSEIKKAIVQAYGVKPLKIALINTKGKPVGRRRGRGKRRDIRKAIVTLSANDSISMFEGV